MGREQDPDRRLPAWRLHGRFPETVSVALAFRYPGTTFYTLSQCRKSRWGATRTAHTTARRAGVGPARALA